MNNAFLAFFILITFCSKSYSEELFFYIDNLTSQKIVIQNLDGVKVSASCEIERKKCLSFIVKTSEKIIKNSTYIGNPASILCKKKGGRSIILKDEKNNDYDYCNFEVKFYVNSWDMLKKERN